MDEICSALPRLCFLDIGSDGGARPEQLRRKSAVYAGSAIETAAVNYDASREAKGAIRDVRAR